MYRYIRNLTYKLLDEVGGFSLLFFAYLDSRFLSLSRKKRKRWFRQVVYSWNGDSFSKKQIYRRNNRFSPIQTNCLCTTLGGVRVSSSVLCVRTSIPEIFSIISRYSTAKKFPFPFNPPPLRVIRVHVFLSFFFSPSICLFGGKWSRILYTHIYIYRSFQERVLTYKTLSSEIEVCIPRNKRVSPFPPDGYKDLTISNCEGRGWERLRRKLFRNGSTGRDTNAARRQIS